MVDKIDIAKSIIARRASATNVPFEEVELPRGQGEDPWKPQLNFCHANVKDWLSQNPRHKEVCGYILDDYSPGRCVVQAHSVVERDDGSLFDITPMRGSKRYPFVRHIGPQEEFNAMKGHEGTEVLTDDN